MLREVKQLFHVLALTKRLRMLKLIETGDTYGAELAVALGMSYSNACRHLRAMAAAGLVEAREAGTRIFYSVPRGRALGAQLTRTVCTWLDDDETVKKDLRRFEKAKTKVRGR